MLRPKKRFWLFAAISLSCILPLGIVAVHATAQNIALQAATVNDSGTSVHTLDELVSLGRKGDILVSATNFSGFNVFDIGFYFRHGHAAIVYSEEEIIHCLGVGNVSELASLEAFGEAEQVRLYTVSGVSDAEAAAVADYAKENLLGIPYTFAADAFSTNTLNCTTIVYHAYLNETGITLNGLLHTVSPESFVQDERTLCLGNIGWQGDANSFANEGRS